MGTWRGDGQGLWTADPPFRYHEEVQFSHNGKPFLIYGQKTRAADDGRPMHMETGYLRPGDGKTAELVVAQPTGFAEIQTGPLRQQHLILTAANIGRTPTAINVTGIERRIWREGDDLKYLVRISMNDEPLADHLSAVLHLVPD